VIFALVIDNEGRTEKDCPFFILKGLI